jgi:hypothetical protein
MVLRQALAAGLLFAFAAAPASVMAQQKRVPDSDVATNAGSPMAISGVVLSPNVKQQSLRVCFSLTNLTAQNVSSAKFHFALLDQFGQEVLGANLTRNAAGNGFAPGRTVNPPDITAAGYSDTNDGSQSCWLVAVTNPAALQSVNGEQISKMSLNVVAMTYVDGSVWTQGEKFARAFNADGSAFVFTPEQFQTSWSTEADTAPIAVTDASLESLASSDNKGQMQQCVSFRNVTNKVATAVKFAYIFTDAGGAALPNSLNWHNTFAGKFTQPILIENKCWAATLPPVSVVRRMRHEVVQVSSVSFIDGSQWTRGAGWVKAFNDAGNALSEPQTIAAGSISNVVSPPNAQSADSLAGTVGPTGQRFGEIAWVKGSISAFGVADDQATPFDAQFAAMSACKTRAGASGGSCQLMLNGQALNSPATRCVILLFDGAHYAVGRGTSQEAADRDGINRLTSSGGSVDSARTIVKACNAQ